MLLYEQGLEASMRREIDELAHAKNRMLERAEVSVVVSHTGLWVPGCTNVRCLGKCVVPQNTSNQMVVVSKQRNEEIFARQTLTAKMQ